MKNELLVMPLATLLTVFLTASGAAAVTCHCFRDRTFEPARPGSADPYILATTRNSLAAAAAGVDKGSVVRQRMTGATENDLWLFTYLPGRLGVDAEAVRTARARNGGWKAALESLVPDPAALPSGLMAAAAAEDPEAMSVALADEVLAAAFAEKKTVLSTLHRDGANIAEATLSVFIARRSSGEAVAVYKKVASGGETWGSILHSLGIRLDQVGDLIIEKVRAAK